MHPKAHNIAILAALLQLEQCGLPDDERTGPTMRDLKEALPSMNDREFQTTMKNLRRRAKVRVANTVSVPYCARKVAVYGLWMGDLPTTAGQHAESLALWASMPVSIPVAMEEAATV